MKECTSNQCCCPCHEQHQACPSEGSEHGEFGRYFLELADEAWEEVLRDEIKSYILGTQKARMKGLAKIVAEANNHRWRLKMEKKRGSAEFEQELHSFMSRPKK